MMYEQLVNGLPLERINPQEGDRSILYYRTAPTTDGADALFECLAQRVEGLLLHPHDSGRDWVISHHYLSDRKDAEPYRVIVAKTATILLETEAIVKDLLADDTRVEQFALLVPENFRFTHLYQQLLTHPEIDILEVWGEVNYHGPLPFNSIAVIGLRTPKNHNPIVMRLFDERQGVVGERLVQLSTLLDGHWPKLSVTAVPPVHITPETQHPPQPLTGEVLRVNVESNQVCFSLSEFTAEEGMWLPLPPYLPAWALDGTIFTVDVPASVDTPEKLQESVAAFTNFSHTPRPWLSFEELQESLLSLLEE